VFFFVFLLLFVLLFVVMLVIGPPINLLTTKHECSCFFSPFRSLQLQKCVLTGAMCAIEPGSPLQLLFALLACLIYMLIVLYAGPYKGNLEDSLAFGTSLCLCLSLLLGLCLITDYPETPDNIYDPNPVFPVGVLGAILILINVLPFGYFFYASAVIVKHGPLVGMRFGASTPDHQKTQVQETITQRRRQGRYQRNLSLAHVQKVVDTDRVEKLEKHTAAHRMAAIQRIQAREKKADARVRQRLRDRRQQKLKNEKKSEHLTKVVPVAAAPPAAPPYTKKYDPTSNAARVPVSSIPVETMAQKDIDALRQSIHDKIGTVQRLQVIFGKLDQDKTLTLSPSEFRRLIGSVLRPPPTKTVFKAIWLDVCQLRKSGDGMKEIDFETFKAWLDF
jgi:hypothetical protein